MNFLKCIACGSSAIKIFGINPLNGSVKSKCINCGLCSLEQKDKIKKPEVIYTR
jgi:hypothetical protein